MTKPTVYSRRLPSGFSPTAFGNSSFELHVLIEQIVVAHLSDLHFGSKVVGGHLHGRHSARLCLALPNALEVARDITDLADTEPLHFAITGDLTNNGSESQFAVSHTFVRRTIQLRLFAPLRLMGLGGQDQHVATIPGNHDHWAGKPWAWSPALSPQALRSHFLPTPWKHVWTSSAGRLRVTLFGIDSTSGLSEVVRSGRTAVGRISKTELEALLALLEEDAREAEASTAVSVRAILCHHSISYEDVRGGGFNELDRDSRADLVDMAGRFAVSAILTGDIHDFFFGSLEAFMTVQSVPPWEFRSAATLTETRASKPGFWVHQIHSTNGSPDWNAWRFTWSGAKFIPDGEPLTLPRLLRRSRHG